MGIEHHSRQSPKTRPRHRTLKSQYLVHTPRPLQRRNGRPQPRQNNIRRALLRRSNRSPIHKIYILLSTKFRSSQGIRTSLHTLLPLPNPPTNNSPNPPHPPRRVVSPPACLLHPLALGLAISLLRPQRTRRFCFIGSRIPCFLQMARPLESNKTPSVPRSQLFLSHHI